MTQPPASSSLAVSHTPATATLSHEFLAALEEERHHLYTLAFAKAGSLAAAEGLLLQTARDTFGQYAKESHSRPVDAMIKSLALPSEPVSPVPAPQAEVSGLPTAPHRPMPADVWARIAAAVQIEAARSTNAKALNPDSVLLRPDPLLAPKKASPRRDADTFEFTSPGRLVAGGFVVLLVGLIVTLYILTRPAATRSGHHSGGGPPASSSPASVSDRESP
jgi:hypothetical protein